MPETHAVPMASARVLKRLIAVRVSPGGVRRVAMPRPNVGHAALYTRPQRTGKRRGVSDMFGMHRAAGTHKGLVCVVPCMQTTPCLGWRAGGRGSRVPRLAGWRGLAGGDAYHGDSIQTITPPLHYWRKGLCASRPPPQGMRSSPMPPGPT